TASVSLWRTPFGLPQGLGLPPPLMKRPNASRSFGYSRTAISDVVFSCFSSMLSSSKQPKGTSGPHTKRIAVLPTGHAVRGDQRDQIFLRDDDPLGSSSGL